MDGSVNAYNYSISNGYATVNSSGLDGWLHSNDVSGSGAQILSNNTGLGGGTNLPLTGIPGIYSGGGGTPFPAGSKVATAEINGQLNMVGATADGNLWLTTRNPSSGTWTPFNASTGNIKASAGNPGTVVSVAAANVNGVLNVLAVTNDGNLWHTYQNSNGTFVGFGRVIDNTGIQNPGLFTAVGATGLYDSAKSAYELHVLAITTNGQLWHAIRYATASPSWFGFGRVTDNAGIGQPAPGPFTSVAAANVNNDLNVLAVTSDGNLWHAIRFTTATPYWNGFGNVKTLSGNIGTITGVGAAGVYDSAKGIYELNVLAVTSAGNLEHAVRYVTATPYWGGFGNVEQATNSTVLGSIIDVTAANVGDDLNVVAVTSDGTPNHTIRYTAPATWFQGWGNIDQMAGNPGKF